VESRNGSGEGLEVGIFGGGEGGEMMGESVWVMSAANAIVNGD